jgi:hypothetical protein
VELVVLELVYPKKPIFQRVTLKTVR